MLKKLCCMRLSTVGMVIGWLGLVGSIMSSMVFCGMLFYTSARPQKFVDLQQESIHNLMFYDEIYRRQIVAYSVCFGVSILQLVSSGMLVLGTLKKRHLMLLPWLINSSISIATAALFLLVTLYFIFASTDPVLFISLFFIQSISVGVGILLFIAIYSLYKEIQFANDRKELPLMPTQTQEVEAHDSTTYPNYAKL